MLALWAHTLLIVAVLAGIAWRRRWRATRIFPLHLGLAVVHKVAQLAHYVDPRQWLPWLLIDLTLHILALCVAVEIGGRVFHRRLPGGRTDIGRAFVFALGVGFVAALLWGRTLLGTPTDRDLYFALVAAGRCVGAISTAMFTLLALMVVTRFNWYLDPYHRDVAAGFLFFQWVWLLGAPWPSGAVLVSPQVWPVWVYGGVLMLWVRAAWRPVDDLGLEPEDRALVLPWQGVVR